MITQQQLQAASRSLPAQFSLGELVDKLLGETSDLLPRPVPSVSATSLPPAPTRPANLTPEQAAEWDYYTSPEARALYNRYPVSPEIKALFGIAADLSEEDKMKTAKDWEAERIKEKYGV